MASYCGKCNRIWDGSIDFVSCESSSATFDIECVKISKTVFKATNDSRNWSWRCDSCRYSSYRTMTNAVKELTTIVNFVRSEMDLINKKLDHVSNVNNTNSTTSLSANNKSEEMLVSDALIQDQATNRVNTTTKTKSKQVAPTRTVQTRSTHRTVINNSNAAPDPTPELSAADTATNGNVMIQAAERTDK